MTRLARIILSVVLVTAVAAPAVAQEVLSKRVSVDLKAMAPADALKVLADSVGLKIVVDPAVTAPVDILVRNVTARTALNTICESIGCRWTVASGTISVKPMLDVKVAVKPRVKWVVDASAKARGVKSDQIQSAFKKKLPADMKFEKAPLATVSDRLSEALGFTVTITCDDPVVQTLTADLSNQTLQSGLHSLFEAAHPAVTTWHIRFKDKGATGSVESGLDMTIAVGSRVVKKK